MKKWYEYFYYGFWIFIFGCIFGYFYESILELIKHGVWTSRAGLIYGPFSQVYGIGALVFAITLNRFQKPTSLFLASTLIGGIAEYIMSLIQEYVFGTISWDYSSYFLNINGRTSLFHALCWGIIGLVFMKGIYPHLIRIFTIFKNKIGYIFTCLFAIFMIFDFFISSAAAIRQDERIHQIQADNAFEEFLDQHYPDDRMNAVYNNRKYRNS